MDFNEQIKQFSDKIRFLKDSISTEEATKTSIIMPFFSLLGYDVFNPHEFLPEFVADVGIKKGEKVDYAIFINNEPIILIEAKVINKNLEKHDSQLFRYFATTKAKFAILTNGLEYRFYTDIEEINKMDKEPFLEFDILNLSDTDIAELKKFMKPNFNINDICSNAALLKYVNKFKVIFQNQLNSPTDDFVRLFLQNAYKGTKTQNIIEKFRPILKKSLNEFINEKINEKMKSAIETPEENNTMIQNLETISISDDEQEAFFAAKNILKNTVDMNDLSYKKTDYYLAVLFKNNTRKWLCRFIFNSAQKSLILPDKNKNEIKLKLNSINDIYRYENDIISVVQRYLEPKITPYTVDLVRHSPHKKRIRPNKHLVKR